MPENDLGTAHGNIRLDFDDRASAQSAAALAKIRAQMEALQSRFDKAEKTIEDFNKELAKGNKEIDVTVKKTKDYDRSLLSLHKSSLGLARDSKELYTTIHKVADAFDKVKAATSSYLIAGKVINAFQNNLRGASKELDGVNGFLRLNYVRTGLFYKSMKQVGLISKDTAKSLAAWKLGTSKAMKDMPRWTQDVHAFAGGLAKFGLAATFVGKAVESGKLTKYFNSFANLGPIKQAILHSDRFAESLDKVFRGIENGPIRFKNFSAPFEGFGKDAQRFLGGIALVNSGVDDLIRRFAFLAKIPKPIWYALGVGISDILPAALKVGAKALIGTSNLIEGLWDGVKQLSGGLLVLPGVFATIGAAVSPLLIIFGGLKDKFKDLFSDDEIKSLTAFYNLPIALRPAATALLNVAEGFKAIRKNLQTVALRGIQDDIRSLAIAYFPKLETGARQVILSFRQMKDELVKFALAGQTQKDFSTIYANTATALLGVSRAVRPAADGLRDIAVVGNDWISTMSVGLPRITQQFAAWAQVNRNNGRIYDWIDNARHGFVELYKGTVQLTEGTFKLLTTFKTDNGENFLDRYAAAMTKFNEAVRRSEAVGVLNTIGNAIRNMAGRDIDNFKSLWQDIERFIGNVTPVINSVASAFQGPFLFALEAALHEFGLIAEAIHAMGLDSMLGTILGLAAGFSAFSNLMVPVVTKLKVFVGLWLSLSTVSGLIKGIDGVTGRLAEGLANLGTKGEKAATIVTNIGEAVVSAAPKLLNIAGVLGGVAIAALAIYTVWSQGSEEIKKFNDSVDAANKDTAKFSQSLNQAFTKDRAAVGNNVLSSLSEGLNTLESDLKRTGDNAPGAMAHIKDAFDFSKKKTTGQFLFGWLAGESDEINKVQASAEHASKAAAGIEELRKRGIDLNAVLLQSDDGFKAWSESLKNGTDNEQAAGEELAKYHQIAIAALEDERRLGPAGEEAAAAFQKIAHAAGDATTKLEGIKELFQALGLLQLSADEAAANYAKTLTDMSDKIAQAVEEGDGLQNVFKDGHFNTADKTAQNLIPLFKDLSNSFLDAAVRGGNLDDMFKDLNSHIKDWASQLHVSEDFLKNFLTTEAGLANNPLKILVEISQPGIDETTKRFGELLAHLEAMAITHNPFEALKFNTPELAQQFVDQVNKALGGSVLKAEGATVTIGAQLDQSQWDALLKYLSDHHVDTSGIGGPPPSGPAPTLPVAPVPVGGAPVPGLPAPPPSAAPPNTSPVAPGYNEGGNNPAPFGIPGYTGGNSGPFAIPGFNPDSLFGGNQTPQTGGLLDGLNQSLQGVTQGLQAAVGAVGNFVQGLVDKFNDKDFLTSVHDSGLKFGEALAKGLTDGSADAFRAAEQIAQGIKDRFHSSPPKKGPLSRHGDAAIWAGTQFVLAYARGVNSAAPRAAAAAGNVGSGVARSAAASALGSVGAPSTGGAGGVAFSASGGVGAGIGGAGYGGAGFSSALGGVAAGTPSYAAPGAGIEDAGKNFGKRLSGLVQFIGHAVDAFSKLAQVGLQFGKFVSDPLGQGNFFGKSLGAQFGYRPIPAPKPGQLTPGQKLADRRLGLGLGANQQYANLQGYNPLTGYNNAPPGQLGPNSSKDQIIAGIVAEGKRRNLPDKVIAGAVAAAGVETGDTFNPLANGGIQPGPGGGAGTEADRVLGLFQEKGSFGTPEQRQDPNGAISRFYDRYVPQLQSAPGYWGPGQGVDPAIAATLAQNPQLGANAPGSDYATKVGKRIPEYLKQVQDLASKGGLYPTTSGALPGAGVGGALAPPAALHDQPGFQSRPAAQTLAAIIASQFGIGDIGGARSDSLPYHSEGRAIDINIPNWQTPEGVDLGNRIKAFVLANAEALGVEDTIWQDFWQPPGGPGKPYGGKAGDPNDKHLTHVHVTLKSGAVPNIGPQGSLLKFPFGAPGVVPQGAFAPPQLPGAPPPTGTAQQWQQDASGKWVPAATPVPGGPGSQSVTSGSRLSSIATPDGGFDVKDDLTGKIIQHVPANLPGPLDIKDEGGSGLVLGRALPGQKPNEPPVLAPPEALGPDGKPWTQASIEQFKKDHPLQISYPAGTTTADANAVTGLFPGGQPQTQYQLQQGLPPETQAAYAQGLQGVNAPQNLQILEIQRQQFLAAGTGANANDPQAAYARAQAQQIEQYQNDIMSQNNLEEAPNPFDSALNFLGQASGIAGDVINSIQAGIDAIGATADITDLVSRGVSNSKQITQIVDDTQKYITFAADVAQTTGDVLSTIGSLASAAGGSSGAPGGGAAGAALQAAGEVASLISAGLQAANAVIDLGQEAAKMVGTFIGPKLESLVGGAEGGLTGDVKFLLDTQDKQLYAYGADNPLDKRAHSLFNHGQPIPDTTRNQLVGTVNVYGGPGTDPRDDTRQMMYQIKASSLTAATSG